jgi:glycosyltransferase involved in cell wall biosynthesis
LKRAGALRSGSGGVLWLRRVRIAYLFDRALPANETDSEQAMQTICALARRGHDLLLVTPRGARSVDQRTLLDHYQVRADFELVLIDNPLRGFSTARKWLHAARALTQVHALHPDLIYTRNFPTLALASHARTPFAYETYRPWFSQFPVLKPAFRHALRHPDCLGAVLHSRYACEHFVRLGIPEDRLQVVHNGYDPAPYANAPSKLALRDQLGLPRDAAIATYVGHIDVTKGIDVILKMATLLPDVRFVLVGSTQRGVIERLAARHSNVSVVAFRSRSALFARVGRTDSATELCAIEAHRQYRAADEAVPVSCGGPAHSCARYARRPRTAP